MVEGTRYDSHGRSRPWYPYDNPHGRRRLPGGFKGAVCKIVSRSSHAYHWLIVPRISQQTEVASLLALAAVDRELRLLQPTLMPTRPPIAFLRDDARFRHQFSRTFPGWVEAEIAEIGQKLRPFAARVIREVHDGPSAVLTPPPSDFPMGDLTGRTYELAMPQVAVRRGAAEAALTGMPQDTHIRLEYERDRYLRHLDDARLRRRGKDIFRNLHQIDGIGRVTLEQTEVTGHWMRVFTELLHEVQLRGYGPEFLGRGIREGIPLPTAEAAELFRNAAGTVNAVVPPSYPYLVKYLKPEYAHDAITRGKILLNPASRYRDPSLDPARFDEELMRNIDVDMSLFPFVRDGRNTFQGGPVGRLPQALAFSRNFLVYCLSGRLRTRLFADFDVTAALIIKEPDEFLSRLIGAARLQLPGWIVHARRIEYYDPLNVSPGEVRPLFWKDFAYAYQEEVRIACTPPPDLTEVARVFLELGPLGEIADIISV